MYGRKILSMTDTMMTVVGEFQNSIDRRIAGMTARKGKIREWEWTSVDAALETTRLWPIK